MPWIRCPYGCIFNFPALNWGVFEKFPTSALVCDVCKRSNWAMFYSESPDSAAVQAVDGVVKPNKPWQVEMDKSVRTRMSKVMGKIQWFGYNQEKLVNQLHDKVCQLLINSELTSNFPTSRIWGILSSGGELKNMWAKGAKKSDSTYNEERDSGEKRLFSGLSSSVSSAPTGVGRPYYIALSPGCLMQGAAPYYGRSYVVYRDAVKLRCTFTATDSLQMLKQATTTNSWDVCSITTIANILMRVTDEELKYLCCLANGTEAISPNQFIEAQGWGGMNLMTDVAILVISEHDLKVMVTDKSKEPDLVAPEIMNLSPDARRKAIEDLKQLLVKFCSSSGITLKFLPLGPDTMNSYQRRPK
jgi:hypothetical protein